MLHNVQQEEALFKNELVSLANEYTGHSNISREDILNGESLTEDLVVPIDADFEALKELNPEIQGWLKIENTNINYPVMQSKDNQKYLSLSYEGKYQRGGSVYLDWRVNLENSKILLMYGHNMGTGKTIMFSELLNYLDGTYYSQYPAIQFALDDGTKFGEEYEWEIFAVCTVDSKKEENIKSYYSTDFENNEDFISYIENLYRNSIYTTNCTDIPQRVIALGTCLKSGQRSSERLIIYAGVFDKPSIN